MFIIFEKLQQCLVYERTFIFLSATFSEGDWIFKAYAENSFKAYVYAVEEKNTC